MRLALFLSTLVLLFGVSTASAAPPALSNPGSSYAAIKVGTTTATSVVLYLSGDNGGAVSCVIELRLGSTGADSSTSALQTVSCDDWAVGDTSYRIYGLKPFQEYTALLQLTYSDGQTTADGDGPWAEFTTFDDPTGGPRSGSAKGGKQPRAKFSLSVSCSAADPRQRAHSCSGNSNPLLTIRSSIKTHARVCVRRPISVDVTGYPTIKTSCSDPILFPKAKSVVLRLLTILPGVLHFAKGSGLSWAIYRFSVLVPGNRPGTSQAVRIYSLSSGEH